MTTKKYNFPIELLKAIEKDNLIIFVGAGLSYNLKNEKGDTIGGWEKLVEQILVNLKDNGHNVDHFLGLIGKCEPIKILDLIECDTKLPKNTMIEFTKDFLELHESNDYSIHQNLYQLSPKIITTNYDEAFETATRDLKKNTAFKGKNYELTKHKDPEKPLLFKLHGCLNHADSMVLFPSSYQDLYNNPKDDAEHALLVLKNIIVNKTVLFIGCGMGDYQINSLFSYVKKLQKEYNQKHFIITKDKFDSSLEFLEAISINDHDEIPLVIEQLLKEKEHFAKQKTPEEELLEEQLEDAEHKLIDIEIKLKETLNDAERKDVLLEREALKYFSRGLEFQEEEEHEKACEEYEVSSELNPNDDYTFSNWGLSLEKIARKTNNEKLYNLAFEKHEIASKLSPTNPKIFNNWGRTLYKLATVSGNKKHYQEAYKKYRRATEIDSKYALAFYNWASVIIGLYYLTKEEILIKEAFEKSIKAYELGGKSYNLACVYALNKEKKEVLKYLEICLKNKEVPVEHIEKDIDLNFYRNDPDFKALLDKYKHR